MPSRKTPAARKARGLAFAKADLTVRRPMRGLYESVVRPWLFRRDAEEAHALAVRWMARLGAVRPLCRLGEWLHQLDPAVHRPVRLWGLEFPNAVGLAAGFDKNAEAWPAAAALGFGHVEVGTVTAQAQPGNERPRVFRFPAEQAVINRMGFNNAGAAAMAARLARQDPRGRRVIPLGINLGKTKSVAIDVAVADYLESFHRLAEHADYLVLNVSSPNTPDLRKLQDEDRLRELLAAVSTANRERGCVLGGRRVPLLLKVAPDLSWAQVDAVLGAVADFGLDGVIATNTTLARPGPFAQANQAGGLSGPPVRARSTALVRYIARRTEGRLPIIGVGGIDDAASAAEKLEAGATLIQVYTGLIFRGPGLATRLARAVADGQRG